MSKTDFKKGDKFMLELGEKRVGLNEFEIAGTDLYVRTELLGKLKRLNEVKEETRMKGARDVSVITDEIRLNLMDLLKEADEIRAYSLHIILNDLAELDMMSLAKEAEAEKEQVEEAPADPAEEKTDDDDFLESVVGLAKEILMPIIMEKVGSLLGIEQDMPKATEGPKPVES